MPEPLANDQPEESLDDVMGVVLCGGRGSRLGGTDKASLVRGGRPLLDHAADALAPCTVVVAVGDERPGPDHLVWTAETPRFGGPAAGLLAGVHAGRATLGHTPTWVAALAVDMPLVTPGTFRRLRAAVSQDGAVLIDEAGRRQHLCAIYRISTLLEHAPDDPSGMPLGRLLDGLDLATVATRDSEARDVDIDSDLRQVGVDRPDADTQ